MSTNQLERVWEKHYGRTKARLSYPDENLVRMLSAVPDPAGSALLDYGCGSGRHLKLAADFGFGRICGADVSAASLELSRAQLPRAELTLIDPNADAQLPFGQGELQVVILWGVLHYNAPSARAAMLSEIARVLGPNGVLLGTLRASGETHYASNADMQGLDAELFTDQGARSLLSQFFNEIEMGYMERSPIGRLESRVCHWMFRCK